MPPSVVLIAAVLLMGLLAAGCSKTATSTGPSPGTQPAAGPAKAASGDEMASCPVLGTTMPKSKMIPVEHNGKTYYMCCQECVGKFKADPEKYIKNPAKPKPAGEPMGH